MHAHEHEHAHEHDESFTGDLVWFGVLRCQPCGPGMRLLDVVSHPEPIRWWLHRLDMPDEPP